MIRFGGTFWFHADGEGNSRAYAEALERSIPIEDITWMSLKERLRRHDEEWRCRREGERRNNGVGLVQARQIHSETEERPRASQVNA